MTDNFIIQNKFIYLFIYSIIYLFIYSLFKADIKSTKSKKIVKNATAVTCNIIQKIYANIC